MIGILAQRGFAPKLPARLDAATRAPERGDARALPADAEVLASGR